MNIEELIKDGENQVVEFKERVTAPHTLSRIISAFSNTRGGTILIGIREPNIIVGIDPEKLERVYQQAVHRVSGLAATSFEVVSIQNKKIGVVRVEKASTPVGSGEGYFTRIGEAEMALRPDQLTALFSKDIGEKKAIESLSETVSKQTDEIGQLRESFEKANSWRRKFFYAFLGALATGMAKLLLAAVGIAIG